MITFNAFAFVMAAVIFFACTFHVASKAYNDVIVGFLWAILSFVLAAVAYFAGLGWVAFRMAGV